MLKNIEEKKLKASNWFKELSDNICFALEKLEAEALNPFIQQPRGIFTRTPWQKNNGSEGGGIMSILKGRVFEKAAVHTSTTYGEFSPEFRKEIPGAEENPNYWASGISVIVHPYSPLLPTIHMNTRMIVTSKYWFGGGIDLTPMLKKDRAEDTYATSTIKHNLKHICEKHSKIANYEKMAKQCDEYFYLPHRQEPRGTGGIFYDYLASSDDLGGWEADFAFTKDVGVAFYTSYTPIIEALYNQSWTEQQREEQLIQRGRYVEFNLLYDRGTRFGLKTGGNVESILSSLPPTVRFS